MEDYNLECEQEENEICPECGAEMVLIDRGYAYPNNKGYWVSFKCPKCGEIVDNSPSFD